jgi:branched-chain amino acid transport system permease protein
VVFGEIVRGQLGGVLPGLHFFIDGVLIIVVILLMPRGVVPKIAEWWDRRHAAVPENPKIIAETATRT